MTFNASISSRLPSTANTYFGSNGTQNQAPVDLYTLINQTLASADNSGASPSDTLSMLVDSLANSGDPALQDIASQFVDATGQNNDCAAGDGDDDAYGTSQSPDGFDGNVDYYGNDSGNDNSNGDYSAVTGTDNSQRMLDQLFSMLKAEESNRNGGGINVNGNVSSNVYNAYQPDYTGAGSGSALLY